MPLCSDAQREPLRLTLPTDVLIIDPEDAFCESVRIVLLSRGLRCRREPDGARARAALAEDAPRLIVLASELPDGEAAAWLTRTREEGLTAPALLTASASRPDLPEATRSRLGVEAVWRKPVEPEALADAIERILTPAAARDSRSFDEILAELRAAYAVSLVTRVDEILRAVRAVVAEPTSASSLGALRSLAHRLAGTAGSYGFPALSELGAAIEDETLVLERAGPGDSASRAASLRRLVDRAAALRERRASL